MAAYSEKELAATDNTHHIHNYQNTQLLASFLPRIIDSIGALAVGNPSSTKYTHYLFAIKLNGDEFTQLFSKGHGFV